MSLNLTAFLHKYTSTSTVVEPFTAVGSPTVDTLIETLGGQEFNQGIYRIHGTKSSQSWSQIIGEAFVEFAGSVIVFGQDWQGNQFAWCDGDDPGVHLFQITSGEIYVVADSIEDFHNVELVAQAEVTLNESLWKQWVASGGALPKISECIGYTTPLYLDGENELENLEIADIEAYWGINIQLLAQLEELPDVDPA